MTFIAQTIKLNNFMVEANETNNRYERELTLTHLIFYE